MPESNVTVRVAAVQMEPLLGDVPGNRAKIDSRLREAARSGAQLVVFPECALTGYGFGSRAEALDCAEPVQGPSVAHLAAACAELRVHAVFGLLEREGARLFNACVLVGPDGVVGSHRKVHLPYLGVDRFADAGDRPFAVHEAAGLRIGMMICYDGSFPESARVLSLLGADVLVLPTNWPAHSECAAEHMVPCRAMENVVYMMAVNRVGEEAGFRYIGRSSIADPRGATLAAATAEGEAILLAEVDPLLARQKRQVRVPGLHEINRIADRRPRFYTPITAANGRD